MDDESTDRPEGHRHVQAKAQEYRVKLLRSEIDVRAKISRLRADLDREAREHLTRAEETLLTDLRRIVNEREQEIDLIEKRALSRDAHDFDATDLPEPLIVRFLPVESFQLFNRSALRFGSLHLEDMTDSQLQNDVGSLFSNENTNIYSEIQSLRSLPLKEKHHADDEGNNVDLSYASRNRDDTTHVLPRTTSPVQAEYVKDECDYITPVKDDYDKESQSANESDTEITEDPVAQKDNGARNDTCTSDSSDNESYETIFFKPKLERSSSITTVMLFGGESLTQEQDNMYTKLMPLTANRKSTKSDVEGWKTFHQSNTHILHCLPAFHNNDVYSTPKHAMNVGVNSDVNKIEKLNVTPIDREMTKQPELRLAEMDTCRLTVIPDGRLVLLCESNNSLMLYDANYNYVSSLKIKCPKAMCHSTGDQVLVVQLGVYSENVLLIEVKPKYMNQVDGVKFDCQGRIFDITYRGSKTYVGCNDRHLHIFNDKLEEISKVFVTIDELDLPCISMDYNKVSKKLYIVRSTGDLACVDKDGSKMHGSVAIQAIAVCCLDSKAYVMCSKDKYNVVIEVSLKETKHIHQREVIRLTNENTTDMSISPNGQYILLLHSDGRTLFVEKYDIRSHR